MSDYTWITADLISATLKKFQEKNFGPDEVTLLRMIFAAMMLSEEAGRICGEVLAQNYPVQLNALTLLQSGIAIGIRLAELHDSDINPKGGRVN